MGCNSCKSGKGIDLNNLNSESQAKGLGKRLLIFNIKLIVFIMVIPIILLLVIPFSFYVVIKALFFDGRVNTTNGLISLGKYLKDKRKYKDFYEEYYDEIEGEDEYDYIDEDEIEDITQEKIDA
jgi:hypothetical protein